MNVHKSFEGRKLRLIKKNSIGFISSVIRRATQGEKIYVATNTKETAESLFSQLKHIGKTKILLITGDDNTSYINNKYYVNGKESEVLLDEVDTDEWGSYDIVIVTPTISAGVSFTKENHFDRRMGFFTNRSCSSELCFQMMLRVRSVNQDTDIIMYTMTRFFFSGNPITEKDFDKYIFDKRAYFRDHWIGYDYITGTVIKDNYYELFRAYMINRNVSRLYMDLKLKALFESHGFVVTDDDDVPETEEEKAVETQMLSELKVDIKEAKKVRKETEVQNIFKARDIKDETEDQRKEETN